MKSRVIIIPLTFASRLEIILGEARLSRQANLVEVENKTQRRTRNKMSKFKSATYATIKDADGELASISESAFNKLTEDATKANTEPPEALRRQTFLIHEAESIDDILLLCPNELVAVDLFNRGASLKQLNEIRALMESDAADFQVVEGSYDLKDVISRVTERKKMSPMDKVLKALGGLSDEERQAIIGKLVGAQTASA